MASAGCVEVERGEVELLSVEAYRDCAPAISDFWGSGLDWVFPPVLGRARLATLHDTPDAAFRAYQLGHPDRPLNPKRQAIVVKADFRGLDLCGVDVAYADQILEDLEDGVVGLHRELRQIEHKGGQGALLQSSCGGTAVVILEKYFEECVEFGDVVLFERDELVP